MGVFNLTYFSVGRITFVWLVVILVTVTSRAICVLKPQEVTVTRITFVWLVVILVTVTSWGFSTQIALATPTPEVHLVQHLLGKTWVPAHPQRIIALGNPALEAALALHIQPIGAAPWVGAGNPGNFPAYIPNVAKENIIYLGDVNQPSLEKILLLQPDLILGNFVEHREIYKQLSQIAPTVLFDLMRTTWQEVFRGYGQALGKAEKAENVINYYEKRVTKFQQVMGDCLRTKVSVVRFLPNEVRLYMKASFCGTILQDLRLARPSSQDQQKWKESISLEAIPRADGDVLFLARGDSHSRLYKKFTSNPLWQKLGVVKSQKVYQVNYEYWIGGSGPLAANLIVDDLFKYLVVCQFSIDG